MIDKKKTDSSDPWLDRCPFCKSKAEIVPANCFGTLFTVGCTGDYMCFGNVNHVTMIFVDKQSAADAWNRRGTNENT